MTLGEKGMPLPPQSEDAHLLLFNTTVLKINWLDWSPERFTRDGVKLYFSHRQERQQHLLPLIALTYLTFPDTERWVPALKPLRYVSHNTLTQAHSNDSHWGHSQNVLPWWADGNQRKSISNDRLLQSTQLILLVIAVDLIEWLHTLLTQRQVYVQTHIRTLTSKYT